PRTRGRLRHLHRHGLRPSDSRSVGPHLQPELRGPQRDAGRPRVPLQSGDRGCDGNRWQDRRSAGSRKTADVGRAREIPGRHEWVRTAAEGSGLGQGHPRPEHRPAARRESPEGCDRRRGPDPTRGQHLDGPHHAGGREDPPAAVEHPRDRGARLRIRRSDVPGEGEEGRGRIHRRGGQLWTRVLARTRGRRPDVPRRPSRPREELRPHPSRPSEDASVVLIVKKGTVPPTPHTEFYAIPKVLTREEIHGSYGFSGAWSRKVHVRSYPTEQVKPPRKADFSLAPDFPPEAD